MCLWLDLINIEIYDSDHMTENNKTFLCKLFSDIGTSFSKPKGSNFFSTGDTVEHMFWVTNGEARLLRHSLSGADVCLQITNNDLLAESSLYAESYHCDGVAFTQCDGHQIQKRKLADHLKNNPEIQTIHAAYLAGHVKELRTILEIRSFKKVSERLEAWIAVYGLDALKTKQANLIAQQIGVTPAAFYREISKRKNRP